MKRYILFLVLMVVEFLLCDGVLVQHMQSSHIMSQYSPVTAKLIVIKTVPHCSHETQFFCYQIFQ